MTALGMVTGESPVAVAVLDGGGEIVATNRVWDRNATREGFSAVHGQLIGEVAPSLSAGLAGHWDSAALEWPCDVGGVPCWLVVDVCGVPSDAGGAVVSYVDVTRSHGEGVRATRVRLRQQTALATLARDAPEVSESKLLERAADVLVDGLDLDRVHVFVRTPGVEGRDDRPELAVAHCRPVGAGPGETLAMTRLAAGALRSSELLVVSHEDGPDAGDETPQPVSGLALPVADRTGPIAIIVASSRDRRRFSDFDVAFASSLARVVSSALDPSRVKAELRHQARREPVTGLANRTALLEALDIALGEVGDVHVGLILLDIDNFQLVTDSFGHEVGDGLLRAVARRLRLRSGRQVLASLDGSTFALLCPQIGGSEQLGQIAERLRSTVTGAVAVDGREIHVRVRTGVAMASSQDAMGSGELLRRAAVALSSVAHEGGSECARFTPATDQQARERLELANDVHRAVADEELVLHFQPQVDIDSGDVIGVEALVRWQHPRLGLIGPDRFVAAAERSGLIGDLDLWVLDAACRQLAEWNHAGIDVPRVGVNLSPVTLQRADLRPRVQDALQTYGLAPHSLELEVTEHGMIQNPREAGHLLAGLRELGVRLAIDDFGTGYSSLSYLHRFEFNTMKIDQAFVAGLSGPGGHRPSDVGILKAVVALADHLGLDLVAEGVETSLQRDLLRHLGCAAAQGFLYCAPVSAPELGELIRGLVGRPAQSSPAQRAAELAR